MKLDMNKTLKHWSLNHNKYIDFSGGGCLMVYTSTVCLNSALTRDSGTFALQLLSGSCPVDITEHKHLTIKVNRSLLQSG